MDQYDTDQAEQEVRAARDRLINRIDALSERMTPQNLIADAFDGARSGRGGEDLLTQGARAFGNRPLSIGLIGAGILSMALSMSNRHRPRGEGPDVPARAGMAGSDADGSSRLEELLEDAQDRVERAGAAVAAGVERGLDRGRRLSADARGRADQFRDRADQLRGRVHEARDRFDATRERVSGSVQDLPRQASRQVNRASHWVDENRLTAGLAALAIGAAAGSVLASRRRRPRRTSSRIIATPNDPRWTEPDRPGVATGANGAGAGHGIIPATPSTPVRRVPTEAFSAPETREPASANGATSDAGNPVSGDSGSPTVPTPGPSTSRP